MVLSQIYKTLINNNTTVPSQLEDCASAVETIISYDLDVLPYDMKSTLEKSIQLVKEALAEKAFDYFSVNDFTINENIVPILREVVASKLGGVEID